MQTERYNLLRRLMRGEELSFEEASVLGDTSQINSNFPIKYCIRGDKYLGIWMYSQERKNVAKICYIKKPLVIKTHNGGGVDIEKEFKKLEYGIACEVPLVNSEGIFNVYNATTKHFRKAMVMEYVKSGTLRDLLKREKRKSKFGLKMLKRKERLLKKANEFFETFDGSFDGNYLFDSQTHKLYLIDPEHWEIKNANK